MRIDRDLKRWVADFPKGLKKEDIACEALARHPALNRLCNLIDSEEDLLKRLSSAFGGPGEVGRSPADESFCGALEREMAGEVGIRLIRECRRSLNMVLQITRFGRNGEVFRQALMGLFLLDKGVTHKHPLIRKLLYGAAIRTVREEQGTPTHLANRQSLLAVYTSKKRLEYRSMTPSQLVNHLAEAGSFPPEELLAEMVTRGRVVSEPLLCTVSNKLDNLTEDKGDDDGWAVGPACAVLGEIGEVQVVKTLVRCLAVDLSDQATVALAKVGAGALEDLKGLLTGKNADPEVRIQAVAGLTYMTYLHPDLRGEVVNAFREVLSGEGEEDPEVYEWIINGLGEMRAASECEEAIRGLYQRGLMSESEVDLEDALDGGPGWLSVEDAEENPIHRYRYSDEDWMETEEDPEGFPGFLLNGFPEPQEPVRVGEKVGRNDPCPCGSGKKFKKCCGQ